MQHSIQSQTIVVLVSNNWSAQCSVCPDRIVRRNGRQIKEETETLRIILIPLNRPCFGVEISVSKVRFTAFQDFIEGIL